MINVAAIALLLSSLAAAGVWSPAPPNPPADPHLVREGRRVIVVEYERHVPLESPPPTTHNIVEETKDKFQEASNLLPNLGQGVSMPEPPATPAAVEKPAHSAKELICDAYGSCKEKISNAFHKGKEKVSDIEEKASDIKEKVSRKASDIEEKASDIKEKVSRKASDIEEKASDIKESAKDALESTKNKASAIEERAKDAVKRKVESTKEAVRSTVESVKDDAGSIRRNLTGIAGRARDAARHVGAAASVAHLLAFATAYGTCVWVTFVSSHVLAAALPRQQFGVVQSRIYPVYFRALAYSTGAACLGHFFAQRRLVGVERVQAYNLMAALGLVLVNMLYLEPKATKVMFERMKMEKEEGRGRDMDDVLGEPVVTATTTTTAAATQSGAAVGVTKTKTTVAMDQEAVRSRVLKLNKKMKKLNTYSSFLNILTLMSLTWHLVHLSRRLQMSCQ